jgi:hypothetical protein
VIVMYCQNDPSCLRQRVSERCLGERGMEWEYLKSRDIFGISKFGRGINEIFPTFYYLSCLSLTLGDTNNSKYLTIGMSCNKYHYHCVSRNTASRYRPGLSLEGLRNVTLWGTTFVKNLSSVDRSIQEINDVFGERTEGLKLPLFWETAFPQL